MMITAVSNWCGRLQESPRLANNIMVKEGNQKYSPLKISSLERLMSFLSMSPTI